MNKERQTGYYWVKWDDDWKIAVWEYDSWTMHDYRDSFNDKDFSEIDEKPITRTNK